MSRLAVTGAFGYSGKRITRDLLARGDRVLALTNSPGRPHPFDQAIEVAPLAFADPTSLSRSLSGCDVLVNTYWVRFNHRTFSHAQAVADTSYAVGTVTGWFLRDRLITWEEIKGLMQDLLWVDAPAAGTTRLSDWAKAHADSLGRHYASELRRRRDRDVRY